MEIPIFVTIYCEPGNKQLTFGSIGNAGIRLKDETGKVLGEFSLSKEFAPFDAVQMGSLMRNGDGWEYAPIGAGFTGNFGTILASFS